MFLGRVKQGRWRACSILRPPAALSAFVAAMPEAKLDGRTVGAAATG
jgi:hypothetical protein